MPHLVSKKQDAKKSGVYEVAWTWMPFFLANNVELHKHVDLELQARFVDYRYFEGDNSVFDKMSAAVVDIIVAKVPMVGLREALTALIAVNPEIRLRLVEESDEGLQPSEQPNVDGQRMEGGAQAGVEGA
jgi:hypothetical protein